MNKAAPYFVTIALALSGGAFAQDDSTSAPDASGDNGAAQGQPAELKGFVVIQRNIYVPVDSQGNMASKKSWVVIDKQGFVTAEEVAAAQRAEGGKGGEEHSSPSEEDTANTLPPEVDGSAPSASSTAQKHGTIGEGPLVRS